MLFPAPSTMLPSALATPILPSSAPSVQVLPFELTNSSVCAPDKLLDNALVE